MASKKLLDLMNQAIARELTVSVQYMWHHVMARGMRSPEVREIFKEIGMDEMKHAEKIAERLDYLGGVPTTKPDPISVGGGLKEMVQQDLQKEVEAITLYKTIVKLAAQEGDSTTRLLFEEILSKEEEHHNEFKTLLEGD